MGFRIYMFNFDEVFHPHQNCPHHLLKVPCYLGDPLKLAPTSVHSGVGKDNEKVEWRFSRTSSRWAGINVPCIFWIVGGSRAGFF